MARIRVGAVGFLNARPLVYGLDRHPRLDLRFDLPARCADLLHAGETDLGLIPSIEYLRGPDGRPSYEVVPDLAIGSRGAVASVAIYTSREMRDVRSLALDTSSRTSVALTRVMCARAFAVAPEFIHHGPDLPRMLARADAALLIGDAALLHDGGVVEVPAEGNHPPRRAEVEKIDLGALWTTTTGLPFVYAFWAGRPGTVDEALVATLQSARDAGCAHAGDIAREFFPGDTALQALGGRYLRDNIKYGLGPDERAGLERFFQYAEEVGAVSRAVAPRYFGEQP